tara:strand:+ start:2380 stop:3495 length:1116 start_codon:yes stop_codon:yes gene_type:complete
MKHLKSISRAKFVKKITYLFFGFLGIISYPFANIVFFGDKKKMLTISKLPITGPWPTDDPFLFCVHHKDNYPKANNHMGPDYDLSERNIGNDFSNLNGWSMYHGDKIPGFPRHPHRGFETITIVDKGLIDHSDSLGFSARYGDGDVQWLTAGDGIQHSEMFPLLNKKDKNPIDFFQIWINLKSTNKRVAPNFSMFWKKEIPKIIKYDSNKLKTEIEVIAGSYEKNNAPTPPPNSWAFDVKNHVNIWKIKMSDKAKFILPSVENGVVRTLYFYSGGEISINKQKIDKMNMIQINSFDSVEIHSLKDENNILLLQAKQIKEPVVKYGPFVMNSREEIQEAFDDYNKTGFGKWSWADAGPVHGKKYKKFAIGNN